VAAFCNRSGYNSWTDTWIDEALAESTHYVLNGAHDTSPYGRIGWYNSDPYGWIKKGNTFFVWDIGQTVLDDYATAYLFSQWLRIQAGGTDIYKEITKSAYSDYRSVVNAFNAKMGSSYTWDELLKTWFAANYIQNNTGLYGYKNEIYYGGTIQLTRWSVPPGGTTIDLYPGGGVFSNTPTVEPTPSGNIKYAGINMATKAPIQTAWTSADVLLTYNVNTNIDGRTETGTITGHSSVNTPGSSFSVGSAPSGPYEIGIEDMLRQNGFKGWHNDLPSVIRK